MKKWVTFLSVFLIFGGLSVSGFAQTASYDTVSIYDLQYVPNPDSSQFSPYDGDTVVVHGYVMHNPRELWVGARWACYITDGTDNPWSGFFIIQNDTFATNTLFGFVQEGDECYFTGVIDEYTGLSQLAILTDPLVPVNIVSGGNTLPAPKLLTLEDLATHAAAEQWESMLVRIENATVTNNNFSSNQAVITDGTATGYIDDYFWYYRSQFNNGLNPWPSNGTSLNINGFTRDIDQAYLSINPRDDSYFEILTNPPVIDDVLRAPGVPNSMDAVDVTATIIDNGSVSAATLFYSINRGVFQTAAMSVTTADTFQATIPAQPNNSYVRYFIEATDDVGETSRLPGDTSQYVYSYVIRNSGLSVKDVQYTWGYEVDTSPFRGYEVTLEGVITTDTSDWVNNYYIQQKDSAWYGIWIYDPVNRPNKGDWITVTGTVQENFGVTRLGDVSSMTTVTPNYGVPAPIQLNASDITTGGPHAEAYESVLIKIVNLTVTDPFPDAPGNFGEFEVSDGTGAIRVDDAFSAFNGNLDSTYHEDDTIDEITGLHYYSFGDYKILPRNYNDIVNHVDIDISNMAGTVPDQFVLRQNYPNPFNPATTIEFVVPRTSSLRLTVYNTLGQKVRTLIDGVVSQGNKQVIWDGRNDAGNLIGSGIYFYRLEGEGIIMIRKMILMK
ncbi:MAG: T9SS type A sorting domain-containing protein [Calditrichaeota bacterium]|nr:T9SS type A sorting domain-containing protein [Calditrichota bacterium]